MNKSYSRLAELEKRKNTRTTLIFGGLTVVFIIVVILFGIKIVSRIAGFLDEFKNSGTTVGSQDTTPPAPPRLNYVPEFTNKPSIDLEGTSEASSTITISINDEQKDIVTNADGLFTSSIQLNKGENIISLKATDLNGNESTETSGITIVFDEDEPTLEITKPSDGDQFYGSKQKQITLEGKTEPEATVTVNDRIAIVDSEGIFKFNSTLGDGDNSFNVKSTDQAGNLSETTITVKFSP